MSERTKIKETITAGEYGDYKLSFGYDGSNWRPFLINTAGKPQVVELNSGFIKTAVEKIDDLQGALKSVDTDELIARLVTTGGVEINPAKEDGNLASILTALEKIDDWEDPDFPDHSRIVLPLMDTDVLSVTTDAQIDYIAAPGDGHHLEVFGYQIAVEKEASLATLTYAGALYFASSIKYLWAGSMTEGVNQSENIFITGIRVAGGNNEALSLVNFNWGTGNAAIDAIVFYKDITD